MKKDNCIFLMFIFFTQVLFSQLQQSWINRFNYAGNSSDVARDMVTDNSGSVYITGNSEYNDGSHYTTVKYSSTGQQLWRVNYGSPECFNGFTNGIDIDASNNLYITGESNFKITTVKYDENGNQLWVRTYIEGGSDSRGSAIDLEVEDGFIYVIGSFGEPSDMITIKYDQSGNLVWARKFDGLGTEGEVAYKISFDGNDNIYIAGKSFINVNISQFYLLKYKSSGVFQWSRTHQCGGLISGSPKVSYSPDGGVVLAGGSDMGINNKDIFVAKYSSSGEMLWETTVNGNSNLDDDVNSIRLDPSSNIYVLGSIENTATRMDLFIAKYGPDGNSIWSRLYNSESNGMEFGKKLILDNFGNLFAAGYSDLLLGSGYDYLMLMYSNEGILKWSSRYNGPDNNTDVINAISLDNNQNLFVSGFSSGGSTEFDFATIKFNHLIGINPISSEIPSSFSLSQNYPNPFNPVTKIRFQIPLLRGVDAEGGRGVYTKLSIFDILGREITTLVNEQLKPGSYEVEWDASAFPSGVYFYRLQSGTFIQTLKMILIK
jgi:hypothetical protein